MSHNIRIITLLMKALKGSWCTQLKLYKDSFISDVTEENDVEMIGVNHPGSRSGDSLADCSLHDSISAVREGRTVFSNRTVNETKMLKISKYYEFAFCSVGEIQCVHEKVDCYYNAYSKT